MGLYRVKIIDRSESDRRLRIDVGYVIGVSRGRSSEGSVDLCPLLGLDFSDRIQDDPVGSHQQKRKQKPDASSSSVGQFSMAYFFHGERRRWFGRLRNMLGRVFYSIDAANRDHDLFLDLLLDVSNPARAFCK